MSLFSKLLAIVFSIMLLAAILYVLFGQITVRKLRKNPNTKTALGLEYVSGWDIINVAQALSLPRSWSRRLEKSHLATIYANSDILFENTNKIDRILGVTFYWLMIGSGLSGAILVLLNNFGYLQ